MSLVWGAVVRLRDSTSMCKIQSAAGKFVLIVSHRGLKVTSHLWIGRTVWRVGPGPRHMWRRSYPRRDWAEDPNRPPEDSPHADTMKCSVWSLLSCASLLLSDVLATYPLPAVDPQLITAQSLAQTRNNGRPPHRTLNPASKFHWNCHPKYFFWKICSYVYSLPMVVEKENSLQKKIN